MWPSTQHSTMLCHTKCCNNILPCLCVQVDINIWFLGIIFELIFRYYAISSSISTESTRIPHTHTHPNICVCVFSSSSNAIYIGIGCFSSSFAISMFRLCCSHRSRSQSKRINFDFHVHVNEFEWNVNRTDIIINNHVCIDYYYYSQPKSTAINWMPWCNRITQILYHSIYTYTYRIHIKLCVCVRRMPGCVTEKLFIPSKCQNQFAVTFNLPLNYSAIFITHIIHSTCICIPVLHTHKYMCGVCLQPTADAANALTYVHMLTWANGGRDRSESRRRSKQCEWCMRVVEWRNLIRQIFQRTEYIVFKLKWLFKMIIYEVAPSYNDNTCATQHQNETN